MKWNTVGFEKQKIIFNKLIKENALSHAYLFVGIDMIGKKTFANDIARQLGGGVDVATLSPVQSENTNSIAIELVRDAKKFLSTYPQYGTHKVLIIDNAHTLTIEAQNALLKILEEPNSCALLILITSQSDVLLDTIRSRCQEINFQIHTKEIFTEYFKASKFSKEQIDFLYEFSDGRIGLVQNMIKQDSLNDIKQFAKELMELLRAPEYERMAMAKDLASLESQDLQNRVLYWILYMHTKAKNDTKFYGVLKQLQWLYGILLHSQFNKQTALERFTLSL